MFKVIQGYRGRYQSKSYMRLSILINTDRRKKTDILSLIVSELSHLIVQILGTLRFSTTLSLGAWGNVRCS